MAIKIREVKTGTGENQFCSSCLKSKSTGEKELFQIRIKSTGCLFDFFLCKDCFCELDNEIDKVIKR